MLHFALVERLKELLGTDRGASRKADADFDQRLLNAILKLRKSKWKKHYFKNFQWSIQQNAHQIRGTNEFYQKRLKKELSEDSSNTTKEDIPYPLRNASNNIVTRENGNKKYGTARITLRTPL